MTLAVLFRVLRLGVLVSAVLIAVEVYAGDNSGLTEKPFAPRSGPRGPTLFKLLLPADTGIVTANNYADPVTKPGAYRDPRMWGDRYHEFEVGAIGTGVAIGDFDGDGLPDLFVVSKTESCRLFRNLGDWKFEDVTDKAGVRDQGDAAMVWKQGATFVDVNNDGLLDIYVCRFAAPNLLYINQGNGTFKEEAAVRGLAVTDASVMAAFCDYDRDGWLDVFLQTNLLDAAGHPNGQKNYLFHNNGDGTFADVSGKAGITGEAQGHSATWWDYDGDGWPDLYVANDFAGPDKLYRNNRDGTFTDVINAAVPHMPFSSMGSDVGDVNNDGLVDLIVADMAATTHQKDQRTMANMRSMSKDGDENLAPQYLRNALYLNTGTGRVAEAAYLAGLAITDWTWALRFEDLDNDGLLDLFVTNGMHREAHNTDLLARMLTAGTVADKIQMERASPVLNEQHLAFRNLGNLQFENVSAAWGLDQKGVGFGASFGDFDNDGDLDLVHSNYHEGVTVLRNDSQTGHRVIVALKGTRSNRFGVGSLVKIETAAGIQVRPLVLARGVLSSSEPILHFGLGEETTIKQLTVTWPTGERQTFTDLGVDRKFTITEPASPPSTPVSPPPAILARFTDVSDAIHLSIPVREVAIDETAQQSLLPVRQNRRGPALAIGDVNADGKEDVLIGGTPRDPARLMLADDSGNFANAHTAMLGTSETLNDGPILFFDADGDGKIDLLVTKGGSALPAGSIQYQPKLFLNDGRGGFHPAPDGALPPLPMSAGAAAAVDFDHDGRLDLFIGGRTVPGQYPSFPRSALLINRGGKFEDVTDQFAPGLREVGMVTAALWSDVDGDGWPDLLLTLEWGQVKYFHNESGKELRDLTDKSGFGSAGSGWWNSIAAADFNGDGHPDYAVGNLGLNTPYHADATHPAVLFSGDFRGNGAIQLIEGYYEGDKLYPWRTRKDLGYSIPSILKRFPRNDFYARATLGEIIGEDKLAAAQRLVATEFRSGVFLSQPDGSYRFEPLPRIAQISPIQGLVAGDFDGDGKADIYAVQNSYAPIPSVGHFDGGLSQLLLGDGHGHFTAVPPRESNLIVPGDAKALAVLDFNGDGWPDFVISRNNGTTVAYRNNGIPGRRSLGVTLRGPAENPTGIGAHVVLELKDGSTQTSEVLAGSGYFSQSSAGLFFGYSEGNPPRTIRVRWPLGLKTVHELAESNSGTIILKMP